MQNKANILAALESNGISPKGAKVYLALLSEGEATPAQLATTCRLKRPTVYVVLDELKEQGLTTEVRKGRGKQVRALDPSLLLEQRVESMAALKEVLPTLHQLHGIRSAGAEMRVFQGETGLKQVMEDTLTARNKIYCWVDIEGVTERAFKDYWRRYLRRRVERGISVAAIMPDCETARRFCRRDKAELRETRVLSRTKLMDKCEVNIYDDKIAFVSFADLSGVIIENAALSKMQRAIFQVFWDSLPKARD